MSQRERQQEVVVAFLAAAKTIVPDPKRTFLQLYVKTNGPVRNCGRVRRRERDRFEQLPDDLTPVPSQVWAGRRGVYDVPLGLPKERRVDAANLLQKLLGDRAPSELINFLVDIRINESHLAPYLREKFAGLSSLRLRSTDRRCDTGNQSHF